MSKAGRKGNGFEADMEAFRKYFSRGKKKTQYKKAIKLKKYCDWIDKTPEELIKEYAEARKSVNTLQDWKRDTRTKIIEFYNWLKAEGYKINTARTLPLGVMAFYSEKCETIKDVTKEFDAVQIPTDEYVFTQEVLRKAYYYADLEGQTLLSLAVALGYSSIDFLNLECKQLQNLVNEANTLTYIKDSETRISAIKTEINLSPSLTPEIKEDAITALNNSETNLENARDLIETNMVDDAISFQ